MTAPTWLLLVIFVYSIMDGTIGQMVWELGVNNTDEVDGRRYLVVKNHEEQYSIWFEGRPLPAGWTAVGEGGSKEHCLAYIKGVWTDMRPASLRREMDAKS